MFNYIDGNLIIVNTLIFIHILLFYYILYKLIQMKMFISIGSKHPTLLYNKSYFYDTYILLLLFIDF